MVASYSVNPENPSLPGGIGLGPGIVVNPTPSDRDGIDQLGIIQGDTVTVNAVSHLGDARPSLEWRSEDPAIVAVEADTDDPGTAHAVALGEVGESVVVSATDIANGFVKTVECRLRPRPLTVGLPGGATMELVWIEPGTFTMGSPPSEPGRGEDEGPQHEVTISQGFYLGQHEITQEQWEAVTGTAPWSGQSHVESNPTHPAVPLSWDWVQSFIARLNEAAGEDIYRLPHCRVFSPE